MTFLNRFSFTLLGAIGLVSLASGACQFEQHIGASVYVWQAATRLLWEAFPGSLLNWLGAGLPLWTMDYATMGLVTAFISARLELKEEGDMQRKHIVISLIIVAALWPITIISTIISLFHGKDAVFENQDSAVVFYETYLGAVIIIVINYALILFGARIFVPDLMWRV